MQKTHIRPGQHYAVARPSQPPEEAERARVESTSPRNGVRVTFDHTPETAYVVPSGRVLRLWAEHELLLAEGA